MRPLKNHHAVVFCFVRCVIPDMVRIKRKVFLFRATMLIFERKGTIPCPLSH